MRRIIFWFYATLLFFVPLVLWPFTSEVFEFNKIVLMYILTAFITSAWLIRMIAERKIIFRRTLLDIPLILFLAAQIISTFLSIDFYTSLLGYYSRFNGGLLSTVCYLILYWAYVSNFDSDNTKKLINYSLLPSACLVCLYAVMEHFGIDKTIWVQDVQSRVFSTLGQPNWLAAFVVALIPVSWALFLEKLSNKSKFYIPYSLIYFCISILFFWTLIFTKSRSGFLGFIVMDFIFWGLALWHFRHEILKNFAVPFIVFNLSFIIICLISGTQWTPSLYSYLNHSAIQQSNHSSDTALESGGTESGTLRKIVWQGAVAIWKHYPIFGTGVETFAYSYYQFRPQAHNLTSEWDFIYNKAHNQFLNYAANTGTIGIGTYILIILVSLILITNFLFANSNKLPIKKLKDENTTKNENWKVINYAFAAGFISISVSNFFGFSVVPTDMEFFLFPAFAAVLSLKNNSQNSTDKSLNSIQKSAIAGVLLVSCYVFYLAYGYWKADINYSIAKANNSSQRPDLAEPIITKSIGSEPYQAIYYTERAISYSAIAMAYDQSKDATAAAEISQLAAIDTQKALSLSPANINIRRQIFGIYVRLSTINGDFLSAARTLINDTIKLAPTDPKLYYNMGIADANLDKIENSLNDFQKAIELKPNYTDARIQYAALLVHQNRLSEAKEQLEYILAKLDPNNETAKQALANIK